jgi:flagellar biosynthetic protein FliQ
VTTDQALDLIARLLEATLFIAGPLLMAALMAGVLVGIIQAATQINEASISFVVKASVVLAVLVAIGPALAGRAVEYARDSFESLQHVVVR